MNFTWSNFQFVVLFPEFDAKNRGNSFEFILF